jgi:hypothetical protein
VANAIPNVELSNTAYSLPANAFFNGVNQRALKIDLLVGTPFDSSVSAIPLISSSFFRGQAPGCCIAVMAFSISNIESVTRVLQRVLSPETPCLISIQGDPEAVLNLAKIV